MARHTTPAADWLIRVAGLALLALAALCGHRLVTLGIGHAEHEPVLAYGLALVTFLSASAGAALTALGQRLTGRVIVAERWLPHVPIAFCEEPNPPA